MKKQWSIKKLQVFFSLYLTLKLVLTPNNIITDETPLNLVNVE